ncbi:RING finger protein [Endozoicomonas sp. 8E]|uniref:RING finger protein n=1 Tax=Endozoicomonas sp. 8E TaxID=3035692 RepID=UPI0029390E4B|nr:RING finger protein [Endozoicomonas sp. 8E]WOG29212.1 RING finger protein [Endozoicomonas sp. 8E]
MTLQCAFKTLLFLIFLFFCRQGVANDTYGIEEFRQYQKTYWKPPSKKQKMHTGQPAMSPLENIRIGFVSLNLASDDVSGDERLEICETYEITQQGFELLISFYSNYVNMGDPHYRKVRIQRVLRLMHRIFTININKTNGQSQADKELINATAKSLYEQLFLYVNINGSTNPYFHYFHFATAVEQSNSVGVNHDLVLVFLAFLGPHFLSREELYTNFRVLDQKYTVRSYNRAFDRGLLCKNINEYNSPTSIANQLNTAELDAGTALLIGLTSMASAAFQRMDSGLESQETLETVLIKCLPYELLAIVYSNIASRCYPPSRLVPGAMFTVDGMQEFTLIIVGIDLRALLSEASASESLEYLLDYSESSGSEGSAEESDSEDQDQSIVIQQQNALIAELRQELANQPATEEAGAVGGASEEIKKCPICRNPVTDIMLLQNCGHAGFCEDCAVRLICEQKGCPFCRATPSSYVRVLDMSFP